MPRFDIILPTYGQPELVRRCVDSVIEHSQDYRLIWIENDLRTSIFDHRHLEMDVIYMPQAENIGYTKACNAGIALSTAPYVVLLNSDTEVPEGWLEKMAGGFDGLPVAHPIAAVGPVTDRASQFQGQIGKGGGVCYVDPRLIDHSFGFDARLTFFCIMICREAILDVGYLDERLASGLGADDDWLWRAHSLGWKFAVQTDVTVKHVGAASWKMEERLRLQRQAGEYLKRKYGLPVPIQ